MVALGTAPLVGGVATLTLPTGFSAGTHVLNASYGGSAGYSPSSSSPYSHAVVAGGGTAQSILLAAASSQYLTRTWGSAPTSATAFTVSYWIKRTANLAAFLEVYDGGNWTGPSSQSTIRFDVSDNTQYIIWDGSSALFTAVGNIPMSDLTTWHHVLVAYDSTQSAGLREISYIDGVNAGATDPSLSQAHHMSDNSVMSLIGKSAAAARYLDAKLAYFYYIDGQKLGLSSFTTGTGVGSIHPIPYTGTFGSHGFFLDFRGSNANDQSGNSNNWTLNGSPTFSSDLPT